jgi:opacity protein-like surface antigen
VSMLSFNFNSKGRKMKFQIKKLFTIIVLNLFVFVITSAVYAQGSKYVKEGTYLGVYLTNNQMFGDFDNTRSYYTPGEIFDVPYVDDGTGFGVVLGARGPKGAFEFGFQRSMHDTISVGGGDASYSVIDLNFKVDVFARNRTRPYLLFGFGFPWLTIENGLAEIDYDYYSDDYVISSFDDETFFGFALNAGAGVAYYFHPQWAVTGGFIYRWNWFTSAEGLSLDENLLEKAFCFNIGIAYTF